MPSAIPQSDNAKVSTPPEATVTDLMAALQGIVEGKIPLMEEYRGQQRPMVTFDNAVLQAAVVKRSGNVNWPGIKIETGVKIGARRL